MPTRKDGEGGLGGPLAMHTPDRKSEELGDYGSAGASVAEAWRVAPSEPGSVMSVFSSIPCSKPG